MLLLVLEPELDDRRALGVRRDRAREQREHARVDVRALGEHLGQRRPREQAALRPREGLADRLVVGVEQLAVRAG